MSDYTPNSRKYKEEQKSNSTERKKVEKVVTGKVKTKKKSELHKFTDVFVSDDVSNVKTYIIEDILVPEIKKIISNIVRDSIDMILYGDTQKKRSSSGASYVSYRDYSSRDRRDDHRNESRARTRYSYDDIVFEDRGEAEDVLTRMTELIDTYDSVSVADMYDLAGMSCNYTDNNYGWTNLRNAETIRVGGGYMLRLPKAAPLK